MKIKQKILYQNEYETPDGRTFTDEYQARLHEWRLTAQKVYEVVASVHGRYVDSVAAVYSTEEKAKAACPQTEPHVTYTVRTRYVDEEDQLKLLRKIVAIKPKSK